MNSRGTGYKKRGYSVILTPHFLNEFFDYTTRINHFDAPGGFGNASAPAAVATPTQQKIRIQFSQLEKVYRQKTLLLFSFRFWLRKVFENIVVEF
jgi:hypothetical protein